MKFRNLFMAAALALATVVTTGCMSTHRMGEQELVAPGKAFALDGNDYRIDVVQEDFVLMQRVEPEGNPGEITGWVKEVFRVSRYDLGTGRWYMYENMPGAYLQWAGGDNFVVARDEVALAGADVTLLR